MKNFFLDWMIDAIGWMINTIQRLIDYIERRESRDYQQHKWERRQPEPLKWK